MVTKSGQNFTHQNKTKMAKISHTKIKQLSFGEKRPKLTYTKISRFTVPIPAVLPGQQLFY